MSFCHPPNVSRKQSVMGDASPQQFPCEWKSHYEDEDGLSTEDAALARWHSVDRVAARKLRAENEWSETTVHTTAAIGDRGGQIERVSGGIKRQRPQSACSAAARQRQLEQSHAAIEFEVRASPPRAGQVRQRPQSAKFRTSATTPRLEFPRGELADQLETSKWTGMLHRSPCFRQSRLQRLEIETYALLRFALGKTPSRGMTEAADRADVRHRQRRKQQHANTSRRAGADANRPSSDKQRSNPCGGDMIGILSATTVACGSGAQVVRSKKQQRQVCAVASQSDGAARRSRRQDPQTELETGVDSLEHVSRIESPESEDERRALRERTRLRSNDTKLKLKKKKRVSPARKDPRHAASDDPPVIGRRTAARSHWTARASLALSGSTGGDSNRSPRMDEYVMAVTEPPDLPRATADQQSAKIKKGTAAPKAPKEKMQTPTTPATETRLHQKVSQPHCRAQAIVTVKGPTNAKANCSIVSEEHGQCEEPAAAERLQSVEGADVPAQSNKMNNRVTDELSTAEGASVITWSDEQQEGISAPAALQAEPSGVSRSVSPTLVAPVSPQIEEKREVDDLMQASQRNSDKADESVEREGKTIDLGGGSPRETISTAFALFAEACLSDEEFAEDSQPSELNSDLHEAPSDADRRFEAIFTAQPVDASDSELRGIPQTHQSGNCELLEQNDMDEDEPNISAEKHEPTDGVSDSTTDQEHSINLLGNATQSHNDEQDCRTEIIAQLQTDAEKASFLNQDTSIDSSTGDITMTSGTVSELDTESSEVDKLSKISINARNDTTVGLNNRVIAALPEELPEPSVDIQGIDALDYRSNSLRLFDELDDYQAVDAKPEKVEDRDHTLLVSSEEAVELVPALRATFVGAADVCSNEDSGDCPGSTSKGLICNNMKPTQSAARGPINLITDDQSGKDTLSASTELDTSCNNVEDSPSTPQVPDVIMISSSLGSCADPIAHRTDLCAEAIPVLLRELSNDGEHVRLMHQSPADDSVVNLSRGEVKITQENAMAPTDTDDVGSIAADPSKHSMDNAERTESSSSSGGEAGAVGRETTLASALDVFEQQFEGCNGENGDELLPDEVMPPPDESPSTAVVSIGESDTPCSDNPGVDTLVFISVDANEQLQSGQSGLDSTVVDAADVCNSILSDERERSAPFFDAAGSSDNGVPSAFDPDECNMDVLDPERGVLCEDMSHISIDSSNIRDPITPTNEVDADGQVPALPFVNKQVSFVVEVLGPRQSNENQRFDTGCIDPMSVQPQPLDNPTLLSSESARRIQRQYRCFTARRLMLDQLQFFLKHQRRQARKRSKRESVRSSVVTIARSNSAGSPLPSEEDCITESAELAVVDTPVPVGDNEMSSSFIDDAGAVTIVSEGHQTTPGNEKGDDCAETNSDPRFGTTTDDIESNLDIESRLDEAEHWQREEEEVRTHDESDVTSTEADDVVRDSSAVETTKDLSPTVDTLSDTLDASECREDPLDADDLQHYDNLGDLAEMHPSFDDQLSASQPEDSAVNGDISPDEHSSLVEVACLGNADGDGDAEIDRNENEHEMDGTKESQNYPRESGDDAASGDNMVHEEQSDHVEQWERYMDAANNKSYYYNPRTGESQWTAPTDGRNVDSDLAQEFIPGATIIPNELEQEAENTVGTFEDANAPTSQANWEVRRHSSHLGELRGEWQAFVDEGSQLTFYYNAITGESTWEAPEEFRIDDSSSLSDEVATTTAASTVDNDQWVACVDPASGMTYYANLVTNETSWEKPRESSEGADSTSAPLVPIDLCGLAFEGDADAELVDLCGLAFDGDAEPIGGGLVGDGDVQVPRATNAIGTAGDDEGIEMPYEEDYVIDFEDENQV